MDALSKVRPEHLRRQAYLYIRQSSLRQVHENRESTARQYDLRRRAQGLGWNSDQIVVVDEDLGLSGATAAGRNGFQRLVAEVGLGRVGLVMGLEVSRLARSSTDWHRLLEICALADALILDEDGLYDPSHFNDRLLLGLKGTMSEAELHVLRARLLGGQLNKARRGELWIRPPIGYVGDGNGRLIFDPDQQIHGAVRLLFDTFSRLGSAERIVRHFSQEGLTWPRRLSTGPRAGEVLWVELDHSRVLNILHNPRYTGAFIYGRTRQRKTGVGDYVKYRRIPREEWKVFIPNTHPAYISWDEFEANQAQLLANANGYGPDRRKSPPREGTALLQGLVLCGKCGQRMTVNYYVRKGQPVPNYRCQRRGIQTAQPICLSVPGADLDEAVAQQVLAAVTPAALEVALEVFEELRQRKAEVDRLQRAQVERARQEAELAQRQYLMVRPENRLVADSLEKHWNEKLTELSQAEEKYARHLKVEGTQLNAETRADILALTSDLPQVWKDPRTSARERKRMLRLLVHDVTLKQTEGSIQAAIRWKGGATSSIELPRPKSAPDLFRTTPEIVEMIRALATAQNDVQISRTLNNRWLKPSRGGTFTPSIVRALRIKYGIDSFLQYMRKAGWLSVSEMAAQLGLHHQTVKHFAINGVLNAMRVNGKDEILFEPITGPLPKAQPGKRFKDRHRQFPQCTAKWRNEVQYEA